MAAISISLVGGPGAAADDQRPVVLIADLPARNPAAGPVPAVLAYVDVACRGPAATNCWIAEPSNREAGKCVAMRCFALDNLPRRAHAVQDRRHPRCSIITYCNT